MRIFLCLWANLAIGIFSLRSIYINLYFGDENCIYEQKLRCARRKKEKEVVRKATSQTLSSHNCFWSMLSQRHPRANWKLFTSFLSFRLVNMTITADFCSHIILQKSLTVSCFGPADRIQLCSRGVMETSISQYTWTAPAPACPPRSVFTTDCSGFEYTTYFLKKSYFLLHNHMHSNPHF